MAAAKSLFILAGFLAIVSGARRLTPADFAFTASEEEFEDILDKWLAEEEPKWVQRNLQARESRSIERNSEGCYLKVNGDLGQPQPVYIHNGNYIVPAGATGEIHLNNGEQVLIACTGTGRTIVHSNAISSVNQANVTCVGQDLFVSDGVLSQASAFSGLTCSSNSFHDARRTGNTCYAGKTEIEIGFIVNDKLYEKFWSCFDEEKLEVLYVWYEQNEQNSVHQSGVTRPSWLVGDFFPGVGINNRYTQANQRLVLIDLVGEELADKYLTSSQFLARGHLAAKTDFIFATGQRSSFYFVNAAPQWQPFNAGNWNWLEQNLRGRIGAKGAYTQVWTGTYGISQLRNQNNDFVDYYLYVDNNNNNKLPVPLYFWKVVYNPITKEATAFVSINNPYYTTEECEAMTFCTDRCKNNSNFDWIGWNPQQIAVGWSFCCDMEEFRRVVPYVPEFETTGLFY